MPESEKVYTDKMVVVFIDIEKYSLRPSIIQLGIVRNFTHFVKESITSLSYKDKDKIIKIPTGDGIAVLFPVGETSNGFIRFAEKVIEKIKIHNYQEENSKEAECCFIEKGYCECRKHYAFNVRVGVNIGDVVIFKDINGLKNAVGTPINQASRIMDNAGRNKILASKKVRERIQEWNHQQPFYGDPIWITDKHGLKTEVFPISTESEEEAKHEFKVKNIFEEDLGLPGTFLADDIALKWNEAETALEQFVNILINKKRWIPDLIILSGRGGAIFGSLFSICLSKILNINNELDGRTITTRYVDIEYPRDQERNMDLGALRKSDIMAASRILVFESSCQTGGTFKTIMNWVSRHKEIEIADYALILHESGTYQRNDREPLFYGYKAKYLKNKYPYGEYL